jgi:NCAIR mutase (PurE)-related protein
METERLRSLLSDVESGLVSANEALEQLRVLPFTDLGFAKVDHHRPLRNGNDEVIYAEGKTPEQICAIAREIREGDGGMVLATRVSPDVARKLRTLAGHFEYFEAARIAVLHRAERDVLEERVGQVVVMSAGTSDLHIAEEVVVTLELMGSKTEKIYDVGVAGLHRLLGNWSSFRQARVIVVVAGMEGALPSVVGGLVECPIIAVPTSIGYGANFGGLAALLSMLNSCTPGVSVVNIDNGFGAAIIADRINRIGNR